MKFFRQEEHCNGLPFHPLEDFSDPGIEPMSPVSPTLQADSSLLEPSGKPLVKGYLVSVFKKKIFGDMWKGDYS